MNILNLYYFIEIIESNFNISKAAEKIHISQPALSNFIKGIERDENIELFQRKKGRLSGLTPIGEKFAENARRVIEAHEQLMYDLKNESHRFKGEVVIGIPQLILGIMFSDIVPKLIMENPDVKFKIIELGAYELQRKFVLQEIDFAVLLKPINIASDLVEETFLYSDQLYVYINKHVSQSLQLEDTISMNELCHFDMATFNNSFMIFHHISEQFKKFKLTPRIKLTSKSWDFLLNVTRETNWVTLLPKPITKFANMENIVELKLKEPINWEVVLCSQKHSNQEHLKRHIHDSIVKHFKATHQS